MNGVDVVVNSKGEMIKVLVDVVRNGVFIDNI